MQLDTKPRQKKPPALIKLISIKMNSGRKQMKLSKALPLALVVMSGCASTIERVEYVPVYMCDYFKFIHADGELDTKETLDQIDAHNLKMEECLMIKSQ